MTPSPESQKRRPAEADSYESRYDSRGLFKTIQWLLTGLLLVMCLPLLTGRVPTMGDHIWFALPIRQFYADSLSSGASLDWHPHMFGGFFISGEGQLGVYHPLHLAMYSSLPIRVAYALEFALPSFLLVWGAFRFLRLYFDRTTSGFGATLMAFGVYAIYTTHCTNMSGVYCHIPWLLWLHARMFQSEGQRERIACGLGIAGLTGSQILMGYPQIVVMSVITEVLFTLVSMATRRSWVVAPSAILFGKLGGLCIGAVQLLAGLELLPFTNRSLWGEEAMYIFAMPPRSLMGLISPPLGFAYLGSVTTVLLLWWMVAPRNQQFWDNQRRSLFLFALLTSITGTWLSLGGHGGLYNLLGKLPVIDKLRVAARFMCMAAIGYAVLSTMAFDLLRARVQAASDTILRREKVVLWFPLATYAVAMVYLAVTDQLPTPRFISSLDYSPRTLDICVYWPIAISGVAWAVHSVLDGRRYALTVLVILAGVDSGISNIVPATCGNSWAETMTYEQCRALYRSPPVEITGRVYVPDEFLTNQIMLGGHSTFSGYAGVSPRRQLNQEEVPTWRVAGVQWVYDPKQISPGIQELSEPTKSWYEVPNPLPRIRMISNAVMSQQPSTDLATIDLKSEALVDEPIQIDQGPSGKVHVLHEQAGQIQLRTDTEKRELLTIADTYHPGWMVEVDGQPVKLIRVNGDFLGCVVPPGKHVVEFRFDPPGVAVGRWISGSSMLVLISAGVMLWWYGRATRTTVSGESDAAPSPPVLGQAA